MLLHQYIVILLLFSSGTSEEVFIVLNKPCITDIYIILNLIYIYIYTYIRFSVILRPLLVASAKVTEAYPGLSLSTVGEVDILAGQVVQM